MAEPSASPARPARKLKLGFGSAKIGTTGVSDKTVAMSDRTGDRKRSAMKISFAEPGAPNSHRLHASSPLQPHAEGTSPSTSGQPPPTTITQEPSSSTQRLPHRDSQELDDDYELEDGKTDDIEWLSEQRRQGYKAIDLHHLGASAYALREAGFKARQMCHAKYTREQCLAAGFSNESLRLAGFAEYGRAEWSFGHYIFSSLIHVVEEVKTVSVASPQQNSRGLRFTSASQSSQQKGPATAQPALGVPPQPVPHGSPTKHRSMARMSLSLDAEDDSLPYSPTDDSGPSFEEWQAMLRSHRSAVRSRRVSLESSASIVHMTGGLSGAGLPRTAVQQSGAGGNSREGDWDAEASAAPSSIDGHVSEAGHAPALMKLLPPAALPPPQDPYSV